MTRPAGRARRRKRIKVWVVVWKRTGGIVADVVHDSRRQAAEFAPMFPETRIVKLVEASR